MASVFRTSLCIAHRTFDTTVAPNRAWHYYSCCGVTHVNIPEASRILLVEDDEPDIFLAERAMRRAGVRNRIDVIRNGQDALDYLLNQNAYADRGMYPGPAVVLLDLNLPGLDGRDLLKRTREDPSLRSIPLIVVSTSDDEKDIQFCLGHGVRRYLVKPIRADKLREVLADVPLVELSLQDAVK